VRDVLYILGDGSTWNNRELRYSLRSVDLYLPHDRVFIAGSCPDWCSAYHIPVEDIGPGKLANSVYKLTVALQSGLLADEIVLMNDDFFLLEKRDPLPVAHKGRLAESLTNHPSHQGYYYTAMVSMLRELEEVGIEDPLDYGLHVPFLLRRDWAMQVLQDCEELEDEGYLFRTAYGNLLGIGGERAEDVKQHGFRWEAPPAGQWCFSTDDVMVNNRRFQEFMARTYQKPSRYECR
jgi:hypothetical protein